VTEANVLEGQGNTLCAAMSGFQEPVPVHGNRVTTSIRPENGKWIMSEEQDICKVLLVSSKWKTI
jgi:hypothetical protein